MHWLMLYRIASKYAVPLVLPFSIALGFIGYKIESLISDRYTPPLESVKEKREKRLLKEENQLSPLKEHAFVPKTIFERNLSPSLQEPDPRLEKYKEGS